MESMGGRGRGGEGEEREVRGRTYGRWWHTDAVACVGRTGDLLRPH